MEWKVYTVSWRHVYGSRTANRRSEESVVWGEEHEIDKAAAGGDRFPRSREDIKRAAELDENFKKESAKHYLSSMSRQYCVVLIF